MQDLKYFDPGRRATWLELFFDLIFVVTLGEITRLLSHTVDGHLEPARFWRFVLMFVPVWWIWASHTMYANRFDSDSKPQRLATLAIMGLVLLSSGLIGERFDENYPLIVLCYCGARFILSTMYLHSGYQRHHNTPVATRVASVFVIGAATSLASILFDAPLRYVVFYLGVVADLLGLNAMEHRLANIPVHTDHLIERVGLMTLILLGESVFSLSAGLQDKVWDSGSLAAATTGFLIVASIWWIYFDSFYLLNKQNLTTGHRILYSQLFVLMGLSILANLIRHAILDDMHAADFRVLSAIGTAMFFLGKQYAYFMERRELRRYLVQNTLIVAVLTTVSLTLPTIRFILGGLTVTMICYVALNYRYR